MGRKITAMVVGAIAFFVLGFSFQALIQNPTITLGLSLFLSGCITGYIARRKGMLLAFINTLLFCIGTIAIVQGLIYLSLKQANVPEEIIRAMVQKVVGEPDFNKFLLKVGEVIILSAITAACGAVVGQRIYERRILRRKNI